MKTISEEIPAAQILSKIEATPKKDTMPDQWQSQILARILSKYYVVLVSQADPELVESMKMHPTKDVPQALEIAEGLLGYESSITVIPEGVSAIIC